MNPLLGVRVATKHTVVKVNVQVAAIVGPTSLIFRGSGKTKKISVGLLRPVVGLQKTELEVVGPAVRLGVERTVKIVLAQDVQKG